jgi:hypothetical protein
MIISRQINTIKKRKSNCVLAVDANIGHLTAVFSVGEDQPTVQSFQVSKMFIISHSFSLAIKSISTFYYPQLTGVN